MESNTILNFQVSPTILDTQTKKVWKPIVCPLYKNKYTMSTLKSTKKTELDQRVKLLGSKDSKKQENTT